MAAARSKCSPAWTTAELLDLLSIWGEEAVQSQLHFNHRHLCRFREVCVKKGYDQDTVQCTARVKELRQAYHKAREENHHSSAVPKTCQFYKELDAIFGGDPTCTVKNAMDTLAGLEAVERGPNPEDKFTDEEVVLDNNMEPPVGHAARNCPPLQGRLASLRSYYLAIKRQERRHLLISTAEQDVDACQDLTGIFHRDL
ncbi:hypothetical protein UY3_02916 [Chelonia mydas]|uniref:Myb/SANT-like DNA-binding domain-containing protein n=1 Tax=Chelonia mydas TaxID=8469 RepID=M7BPN1_CHEMY|nr:hypothetical protein UY3_02916 [Chelonia mydas]